MRNLRKLALTVMLTVAASALLAGPAAARSRIEVNPTAFSMAGRLIFLSRAGNVSCDVTLNLTARRLISKVRESQIAVVTAVRIANAASMTVERPICQFLLPVLPLKYDSIGGTLPMILGGRFQFFLAFRFGETFEPCLYQGNIPVLFPENPIRTIRFETVRLRNETCFSEAELVGEMAVTPNLTLRLLE
jgi:hypothetical protein